MATDGDSQFVILGRISGLFGVRGWVKVYSFTNPRTNVLDYPVWYLRGANGWEERRLDSGKAHGKGVIAKLNGIDDRDLAAELIDTEFAVPRTQLPKTGKNEFYWTDLEGLSVHNVEGVDMGRVDYLFATGSNDVMVVAGERQRLIPFTDDAIKGVDLEAGVITVDWDPEF